MYLRSYALYYFGNIVIGIYFHSFHKGSLIGVFGRNNAFFDAVFEGSVYYWKYSSDGAYAAVERQLAYYKTVLYNGFVYLFQTGKYAKGYGQVKGRTFFFSVSRSKVYGYALGGKFNA